ncbi:OmpA/MotB family protein [Eubacterium oxidoreducens]|uniref:Chemotaxis protein MotB n=1 Tax=Eubacterium oxidoreducens TaxID=1732 RepID=A0A1G6AQ86_EUBOX|nr:flagellar motor protein MotB [Eubacterium oxidoreducens]SDB10467.1 chemotaxis protein MotB [Eubacterium oxidoreducens]
MAKRPQEDPPKGSPAWMATFSDLMNLLLCFFVLLFSMSTVDAEKFQLVIASLQSSFSVLPSGGSSVGDGQLISSGISQLENFDVYFDATTTEDGNTEQTPENEDEEEEDSSQGTETQDQALKQEEQTQSEAQQQKEAQESVEEQALAESEKMAEKIEELMEEESITSGVKIDFTTQYVQLTLNGALLFESGQSDIKEEAYTLVDKIGKILENYDSNSIEVEGHTDNVPISTEKYANNNVLSAFRALSVMEYLTDTTSLDPAKMKASGRGEYEPIADNSTSKGRAKNRRVEINIYNSFYSEE